MVVDSEIGKPYWGVKRSGPIQSSAWHLPACFSFCHLTLPSYLKADRPDHSPTHQTIKSAIMSTHVDLPEDIWKLVLQHVPMSQRLSSCALVCQKFKAAAVAATDCIEATLFEQPAVDNLTTYLQQHGRHLTRLILNGECTDDDSDLNWPKLEHLPCQRLQELHLVSLDFRWGPDEDRPSVLDNATAITRLEIQDSNFYLPAVSVLSDLQHLSLIDCSCQFEGRISSSAFAFYRLQQLTYLGLSGLRLRQNLDASLCHISSITGLHTLHIKDCSELMSVTPGLSLPPSLQHLELYYTQYGVFEPSVLAAATQLTHLDLQTDEDMGGVRDGACVLEVLSKLQHLDYLNFSPLECNLPPPSPAYQAWVASSSKLRVLHVGSCDLPDGALAHIFPSAPSLVVLPRLEELYVYQIPPGAMAGVMRCCPALQRLALGGELPGCTHLAALSQLSALTRLEVTLEADDDSRDGASTAATIQSLAGLTRLQEFSATVPIGEGGRVTRRHDLLPLTALRQLTKLEGFFCGLRYNLETQVGAYIRYPALVPAT